METTKIKRSSTIGMKKKKTKKPVCEEPIVEPQPAAEETPIAEPTPELKEIPQVEEPAAEPISSSDPMPQRTRTSPYAEAPVVLLIGPDEKVHYAPRHLLPSGWCKTGQKARFDLSELELETGHTLIHYLYTGAYETLNTEAESPAHSASIELKRALLVYITSSKYELASLQQLATREIEDNGAKLDIFEILTAITNDFAKLEPESCVHELLHKKAKAAFEEDYVVFKSEAFLESLDNAALNKFMMKCVMDLYNDKISHMLNAEKELAQILDQREQHMAAQEDFVTPLADEPTVDECCGQEAFELETVSTEEFCTISCPPSECLAEPPECPDEPPECPDEPPECSYDNFPDEHAPDKQCCEATQAPIEDVAGIATVEVPSNGLEEEIIEDHPAPEPGTAPEPPPVLEDISQDAECVPVSSDSQTIDCEPSPPAPPEDVCVPEPADDELCPYRARHILEGDMWKTCRPCRVMVEQVVVQLSRVDSKLR